MSARVSVSAPATSSVPLADPSGGAAARAASLVDGAGPPSAADGNDSNADDAGTGTGSRAGHPFADALASATRAGMPKSGTSTSTSTSTGSARSAVARSGTAAASGACAAGSPGARASASARSAQSAGALQSGVAPVAGAAASAAPVQGGAAAPTAALIAAAEAASAPTSVAAAAAVAQSAGTDASAADGAASVTDVECTDGNAAASPARSGHHGRSAASDANLEDSASMGCGALALLQSAAASLAVPCQALGAANADAPDDDEAGGDDTALGGASPVLAGTAGAGASLSATPQSTADAVAALSNASSSTELAAGQALTNALVAGTDAAGSVPGSPHGGTAGDVTSQSSAAARAAGWIPQFLSAVPTAAGSDGITGAIAVPMSDPSWPQALAAQVHWMAGSQVQSATLSLSPQHLGPIQVRIDLQQSQINVSFSAAHAETRAALVDAMPRLREMLAAGGLSLGQANVQQQSAGSGSGRPRVGPGLRESAETVDPVAVGAARALGLVDEYV